MNEVHSVQIAFFKKLKQQVSTQKLLANEIADVLKLSRSEAYHKIQGTSLLTLPQIHCLCKTYNVPFFIGGNEASATTSFRYLPFYQQQIPIEKYLVLLNNFLSGINNVREKKLFCATEDIPTFHLFKYPELGAFKMYYWSRRMQASNSTSNVSNFTMQSVSKENIKAAYELYQLYNQIPCVEIWSRGSLFNTVDQIKYAAESGIIKDKKLGRLISQQFISVLQDIEKYAIHGDRQENGSASFQWYFCEVIGNITYLAQIDKKELAFIRFNTFNNMNTDNEVMCKEIRLWMEALIYDAVNFTGKGSKHRNIYLEEAYKICDGLVESFD
jgi:hypothetical protein